MKLKYIVLAVMLSSFFLMNAHARPEMTPEQIAKAKEIASQMKPPVDFDLMLEEADRLEIECDGDLTLKYKIKICSLKVDTAQSKERQAKLDEEAVELINKAADIAEKKLQQAK